MNAINKKHWKQVCFGDYVDHIEETERNPEIRKKAKYVSVDNIESNNLRIQSFAKEEMPTFFRKFKKGQILFSKRNLYLNKVVIADFDGICSPHIWALETKTGLIQDLLPFYMLTQSFFNYTNSNAAGTMSKYLGWEEMSIYKFLLPPLEEQKQIAALFQNIESSIEQVDEQDKNLLQLKNKLLRDLFSDKKEFGNHLTTKDFDIVRFDKIATNISERVEPKKTELSTYIGLEHLDSDNLVIERTGSPEDVIGTKLKIYKGDIIFGKRRAYLRKVAVSHFDGIASAHSMILRANEKNIEKEFLPFFMQSDAFMSRAVQISEGSLSPTIKVKTLAQQEFTMPKMGKQKELILLFKQFDEIRQQLKQQKVTLKNLKQKLLNEILG
jgi:restriction endonuclease S subunit